MYHSISAERRTSPVPWSYLVDPLLQFTAIWCLFSLKIFLVKFGEAGLRPDDLLILLSLIGLALAGRFRRTPISLPLRMYLIFAGIEFLSTTWNATQGRVSFVYSMVFVLRILEYVAFYFIGYSLAHSGFRLERATTWYFWAVCLIVPLQMIGVVPVPGDFGPARASANTNGPYEFAIVCCFILCYIAYKKRHFLVGLLAMVLLALTGSRITLVAAALSLLHFGLTRTRSKGKSLIIAVVLAMFGGGFYLASSSGLISIEAFKRLGNSKSYSLSDMGNVYDAIPVVSTATEYYDGPFQDLNGLDTGSFDGDVSGLIRFTRWITLLKASFSHADTILLGLGPSFGSAAVDGYFTRCLAETGILGLASFLVFLISAITTRKDSNWYFREYVAIMAFSALFIDIFLSYKSMMLLWLWHGMNQYRQQRQTAKVLADA